MDEKFDALMKVYETMDPEAKGAVDMMAKASVWGLFVTGVLTGVASGAIIIKCKNAIWNLCYKKNMKKNIEMMSDIMREEEENS